MTLFDEGDNMTRKENNMSHLNFHITIFLAVI